MLNVLYSGMQSAVTDNVRHATCFHHAVFEWTLCYEIDLFIIVTCNPYHSISPVYIYSFSLYREIDGLLFICLAVAYIA